MAIFYFWSIILWASAFIFVESKTGGLKPESVSDGHCKVYPEIVNDLDAVWTLKPRNYYIPMAGKSLYRRFAEIFLGRPARSKSELNPMNLRMSWVAYALGASGYDDKFVTFTCQSYNPEFDARESRPRLARATCKPLPSKGNPIDSFVITSVMWHKRHSGLVVICSKMLSQDPDELPVRDYFAISTTKTIRSDTVKMFSKKLTELGFNLTNIQFLSYTKESPVDLVPLDAGTDDIDLSDTPIG